MCGVTALAAHFLEKRFKVCFINFLYDLPIEFTVVLLKVINHLKINCSFFRTKVKIRPPPSLESSVSSKEKF